MKLQYKCNCCGNIFESHQKLYYHIKSIHNLNTKEYYDTYLKQENEGKCLNCSKQTRFINVKIGYLNTCSLNCRYEYDKRKERTHRNYKEPAGEVSDSSDLIKFKRSDRVIFTCYKCGSKSEKYVGTLIDSGLVCYKCNHQKCTTYNGKKHIQFQKEPIEINKDTDITQFDNRQRLKFKCIKCGKPCEIRMVCIKSLPKETQCMCKTCKTKYTKKLEYGDENWTNREKAEQTCLDTYGVRHPMMTREVQKKCGKKIYFDGIKFDSSWEIAYYIWLRDNKINFKYHPFKLFYYDSKMKIRTYYPDFKVNNCIVEIKNNYLLNKMSKHKKQCLIDNNVIILKYNDLTEVFNYIKLKYGKNYLKNIKSNKNGILNKNKQNNTNNTKNSIHSSFNFDLLNNEVFNKIQLKNKIVYFLDEYIVLSNEFNDFYVYKYTGLLKKTILIMIENQIWQNYERLKNYLDKNAVFVSKEHPQGLLVAPFITK